MGWPKVARVEYWNALPEAISVRCPPFALLSCPLQASSSFPSRSLSLYLSSFLSVSPLCYASLHGRCGLSLFLASSYPYVRLSFSFLRVPFAKLRSIFHLELRRSLAINPRIHYGLRGPYCSFFATSARCLPADLPTFLPACLLAPVIGFASLRGTTSTIQTRRLSGMRRHSRSLVRRGFSRVPP